MTEMLQKTENVAKNLANENLQDLTEQWKKGELPEGWYYVKGSRVEGIYAYTAEYLNNMYRPGNGERIIEQVPSYEEWQASEKYNKHLEEVIKVYERKDKQATETSIAYNKLAEENAQLKELLKECQEIFDECFSPSAKHGELYKEIDEVLK